MTHVLVTAEEPMVRPLLRNALESQGYAVTMADESLAALAVIRATLHPLVVLIEVKHPSVPGFDVLEAVAADGELAQFHRYVVIAAYPSAAERVRELAPEADWEVLTVPFSMDDVLDAVRRAEGRVGSAR